MDEQIQDPYQSQAAPASDPFAYQTPRQWYQDTHNGQTPPAIGPFYGLRNLLGFTSPEETRFHDSYESLLNQYNYAQQNRMAHGSALAAKLEDERIHAPTVGQLDEDRYRAAYPSLPMTPVQGPGAPVRSQQPLRPPPSDVPNDFSNFDVVKEGPQLGPRPGATSLNQKVSPYGQQLLKEESIKGIYNQEHTVSPAAAVKQLRLAGFPDVTEDKFEPRTPQVFIDNLIRQRHETNTKTYDTSYDVMWKGDRETSPHTPVRAQEAAELQAAGYTGVKEGMTRGQAAHMASAWMNSESYARGRDDAQRRIKENEFKTNPVGDRIWEFARLDEKGDLQKPTDGSLTEEQLLHAGNRNVAKFGKQIDEAQDLRLMSERVDLMHKYSRALFKAAPGLKNVTVQALHTYFAKMGRDEEMTKLVGPNGKRLSLGEVARLYFGLQRSMAEGIQRNINAIKGSGTEPDVTRGLEALPGWFSTENEAEIEMLTLKDNLTRARRFALSQAFGTDEAVKHTRMPSEMAAEERKNAEAAAVKALEMTDVPAPGAVPPPPTAAPGGPLGPPVSPDGVPLPQPTPQEPIVPITSITPVAPGAPPEAVTGAPPVSVLTPRGPAPPPMPPMLPPGVVPVAPVAPSGGPPMPTGPGYGVPQPNISPSRPNNVQQNPIRQDHLQPLPPPMAPRVPPSMPTGPGYGVPQPNVSPGRPNEVMRSPTRPDYVQPLGGSQLTPPGVPSAEAPGGIAGHIADAAPEPPRVKSITPPHPLPPISEYAKGYETLKKSGQTIKLPASAQFAITDIISLWQQTNAYGPRAMYNDLREVLAKHYAGSDLEKELDKLYATIYKLKRNNPSAKDPGEQKPQFHEKAKP